MIHQTLPCPPPKEKPAGRAGSEEKNTDAINHTLRQVREQPSSRRLKAHTKAAAVLRLLMERGERGLNCFEAVREAHDYVLRTTLSNLQVQYGLAFERRWERIPGHAGSAVECVRYWLNEQGLQKAADVLGDVGRQSNTADTL